jgi:MFS transporter, DHA3 family, macrolide efflux protein
MNKFKELAGMRSFLLLWSSLAISLLGSEMTKFALQVHVYSRQGTASSVALLNVFYYLPSILLCFAAGTLADKWDKKKVLLTGFSAGALATLAMLFLYSTGELQVWHLYAINFAVSFVNAFVNPAINVSVTLLSKREHYVAVSGMLLFSASLARIIGPVLAAGVMALSGIQGVFILDIVSFTVAFIVLLRRISIPAMPPQEQTVKEPFLKSCLTGITYLKQHKAVWKCILYFGLINLLAKMGGDDSMLPTMVLTRTGGNELTLSMVLSAAGVGALIGSAAVTIAKKARSRTRVMFLTCAASFLICDLSYGLGRSSAVWITAALLGNILVPFISANNAAIMRSNVPVELQGRVFAARDTVQFLPIPIGLFLGGFLADHVFEPFMLTQSPLQQALSMLVGTGKGSGMAVIMLITAVAGCVSSLISNKNPIYRELD